MNMPWRLRGPACYSALPDGIIFPEVYFCRMHEPAVLRRYIIESSSPLEGVDQDGFNQNSFSVHVPAAVFIGCQQPGHDAGTAQLFNANACGDGDSADDCRADLTAHHNAHGDANAHAAAGCGRQRRGCAPPAGPFAGTGVPGRQGGWHLRQADQGSAGRVPAAQQAVR
ncbi:hypothetical protein SDC9_148317 [bioreactor metagenome]|uniref:Uncharacterized protein n=1 Tax=bioreactor metagenome TaxID=1076179 RepID=A0A645EK69_9ZZZZ